MRERKTEIPAWKQEVVAELKKLIERYPVIGVLDIADLPASQFQQMRQRLKGQAEIVVAKNTLVSLAVREMSKTKDPKLSELTSFLRGQTGVIFTEMNPFKLSKLLRDSKISAPAKPGAKAMKDVVIPAGETDFSPGPVVGELQRVGIKARIQAGKVVILEDCHLLKAGDTISKEIADVLPKFGIMPLELGLKLRAAYEKGMIFAGEALEIDEKKTLEQLKLGSLNAFNLALNINYPTALTIGLMIVKANIAAQNLAINACLPVTEVLPLLLAKANAEMRGLAAAIGSRNSQALDEELRNALGLSAIPAA
ncbi:MAG: 50S ribosomal protein L10 [Candidatus Hadarchaeum sp.]|uniref:50S ribosomal protein L10 n=1 Tax=Candidatus Hadarchaeum sp. TaxID=2883567 RepID=UPI00316F99E6